MKFIFVPVATDLSFTIGIIVTDKSSFTCSVVCCFASVILCSRIPGLTPSQRQLCAESPDALVALGAGHILGSQECQFQFKGTLQHTINKLF